MRIFANNFAPVYSRIVIHSIRTLACRSVGSNDHEIFNYTTAVTRQWPVKNNREMVFSVCSVPRYKHEDLVRLDTRTDWPTDSRANVTSTLSLLS